MGLPVTVTRFFSFCCSLVLAGTCLSALPTAASAAVAADTAGPAPAGPLVERAHGTAGEGCAETTQGSAIAGLRSTAGGSGRKKGLASPWGCSLGAFWKSTAVTAGFITTAEVVEPSGLAPSFTFADTYYTHNEDIPAVIAISSTGTRRATVKLSGATALDWEDIAVGACSSGSSKSCVYVGDIGSSASNFSTRPGSPPSWQVYSFPEPKKLKNATVTPSRFTFVYPGGIQWDAEAMLVDPQTGQIYIFTKRSGRTDVWKFPVVNPQHGATYTLTFLRTIDILALDLTSIDPELTKVTGASAHPCSGRFLLKTYGGNFEFRSAGSLAQAVVAPDAVVKLADTAPTRQEEAISYQQDGTGLLTVDELRTSGSGFRIMLLDRA